jgi:preprotein translocase subunit SecA
VKEISEVLKPAVHLVGTASVRNRQRVSRDLERHVLPIRVDARNDAGGSRNHATAGSVAPSPFPRIWPERLPTFSLVKGRRRSWRVARERHNRHESRRIDNQLRVPCGGGPG